MTIAPDHTATQQNRLSDSAFASNTLVDKLHTKVFSIFVPQPMVLTHEQQNVFWSDPQRLLSGMPKSPSMFTFWKTAEYAEPIPLDTANVCVDGTLLQVAQTTPTPQLSPNVEELGVGSKIGFVAVPEGTIIRYSLNDTDTSDKFVTYAAPFVLSSTAANVTLRAFATSKDLPQSDTLRRVIRVDTVAAPVITPINDDAVVGAPIEDGSSPTQSSPTYTTPITVNKAETIKAIAVSDGLRQSDVVSAAYTLK